MKSQSSAVESPTFFTESPLGKQKRSPRNGRETLSRLNLTKVAVINQTFVSQEGEAGEASMVIHKIFFRPPVLLPNNQCRLVSHPARAALPFPRVIQDENMSNS
jgi:hypothetical protein